MAESEEELDSLLMKVKRRVKKFKTQNSKNEDHGIVPLLHGKLIGKQWKQ